MEWLNYHHLLYFWAAARAGSVTRASQELNLTQPTLSGQIRTLERRLGHPLFSRQGRRLVLTEAGELVFRYADEIFGLGRELLETVRGRPTGQALQFRVGVVDAVPKAVAYRLLVPALECGGDVKLVAVEGKLSSLIGELALHRLDLVLSDAPLPAGSAVRAFSHLLGESGVDFFGAAALARRFRPGFPGSLDGAPVLLPTEGTSLRDALQGWFERRGLKPKVVGEFEDGALLKAFGQSGRGLFPAPSAIRSEIRRQFDVQSLGRVPEVTERFFALSAERRLRHPAVVALSESARNRLFAGSRGQGGPERG